MKNKYCPLLSATAEDSLIECRGALCAWAVKPTGSDEYICALALLAAGEQHE